MTIKDYKYTTSKWEKELEKERGPLTFGILLESHRKCEGMTQQELGDLLGISKASVCDLEKSRKIPSPSRAFEIASVFGVLPSLWVEIALQDHFEERGLKLKVSIQELKKIA